MKKFIIPVLAVLFASCDYIETNYYECEFSQADTTTVAPITTVAPATSISFIDLSLPSGNLWATTNIGASNGLESGLYFSWASKDTTQTDFSMANYWDYAGARYYSEDCYYIYTMNKYKKSNYYVFKDEDDICQDLYGKDVHTPSYEDFKELNENCDICVKTAQLNLFGKEVISKTKVIVITSKKYPSRQLFLPCVGAMDGTELHPDSIGGGYYWTRNKHVKGEMYATEDAAWAVFPGYYSNKFVTWFFQRNFGMPIRPVKYTK